MPLHQKTIPPLTFERCNMTPAGVMALVEHLRTQPLLRDVDNTRLQAMAIAYLAWGGATDNNHTVQHNGLHRAHGEAHGSAATLNWREDLRPPFRNAIMDMLTWFDRLSGGGTLLMHASGTRPPGSPDTTEEVKLDVFIPLNALRTEPDSRIAVTRIIQHYAEHVGLPIMHIWDRAKSLHVGGRIYNPAPRTPTLRNENQPLMPPLTSPVLVFYGRTPGTLETLLARELGDAIGHPIVPPPPATPTPSLPAPPPSTPASTPASPRKVATARIPIAIKVEEGTGVVPAARTSGAQQRSDMASLEARILELEAIIQVQGEEINDLRAILAREEPSRSSHGSPYVSPSASSSTATFGHKKGKAPSARDRFPTSPSVRSSSSASSVSSVTTSSAPSQSPTPTRGPRPSALAASKMLASLKLAHGSRLSSGTASSSKRRSEEAHDTEEVTYQYGFYTDNMVAFHRLPTETLALLHDIHVKYSVPSWASAILVEIDNIDREIAQDLASAMQQDCGVEE